MITDVQYQQERISQISHGSAQIPHTEQYRAGNRQQRMQPERAENDQVADDHNRMWVQGSCQLGAVFVSLVNSSCW